MRLKTNPLIPLAAFALSLGQGCEKNRADDDLPDTPTPRLIEVGSNSERIINVSISQTDGVYTLSLSDIPENGNLECKLNGLALKECYDGMKIDLAAPGQQILTVRSINSGEVLSFGEARFLHESLSASAAAAESSPVIAGDHPLFLQWRGEAFRNGSAVNVEKGYSFAFAPFAKAACAEPVLRCRYDRIDSPFWPKCSDVSGHTINKGQMALGLQYLTIRAECGSKIGPALDVYWYGVTEAYQPLSVESVELSSQSVSFRLQKANDCPEQWLEIQCRANSQLAFKVCDKNLNKEKLVAGYQIRAQCRGEFGPILTF